MEGIVKYTELLITPEVVLQSMFLIFYFNFSARIGLVGPSLLAAHALTSCDSVHCFHGIGKITTIKVMKKRELSLLGKLNSDI